MKVEPAWSRERYGQTDRTALKCYKCGESGHMWRNCPKVVKRVDVLSNEESGATLLMEGIINGRKELCEMDTGAETCMIPQRLAEGLPVVGKLNEDQLDRASWRTRFLFECRWAALTRWSRQR